LSDIERNKQRRLRFLRAVYDLAEGVPSHSVRGVDVAEQLSLSVDNEEFQGLAYYNQKAGYTEALETNWGLLVLTIRGIAEVERNAAAASHQVASTLSTQRPDAGYTELLPDRHRVAGHGEISRKTARTLAQIVLESFSYSIDEFSLVQVDHESLYDFLYENDYPIWFVEDSQRLMDGQSLNLWIMKLHTGTTISDLFPDLQPAQVHELGQTYLQKLSGDILNYYAEESDEVELQQTEYPAEVQYYSAGWSWMASSFAILDY
jgi:hypothetical protein